MNFLLYLIVSQARAAMLVGVDKLADAVQVRSHAAHVCARKLRQVSLAAPVLAILRKS